MTGKGSFQAELERLEAIVRSLEDTDLDLDQAIELFHEGVSRLKVARKLLANTELTVKRAVRSAGGALDDDDADG